MYTTGNPAFLWSFLLSVPPCWFLVLPLLMLHIPQKLINEFQSALSGLTPPKLGIFQIPDIMSFTSRSIPKENLQIWQHCTSESISVAVLMLSELLFLLYLFPSSRVTSAKVLQNKALKSILSCSVSYTTWMCVCACLYSHQCLMQ